MDGGVLLTAAGVGLMFGLNHALDPDHVAAVSTIVTERAGLRRASLVGASWGLGHATSLTLAGGATLALKLNVSGAVARGLEALVALMLVGLGLQALRRALRCRVHAHAHVHDGREHVHLHAHRAGETDAHRHSHPLSGGSKPFLVGIVHGLGGSAGLTLLVLGAAPGLLAGLVYLATLGAGSLLGMLGLSALIGLPLTLLERRYSAIQRRVQVAAGAWSIGLGLYLLGQLPLAALASLAPRP